MLIDTNHLEFCISKAQEFGQYYEDGHYLGGDDPRRYIQYLHDICQKYLSCQINLLALEVPAFGSAVNGAFIMTSDNHYDICVARDLNYCWRRFVFCKEMFHVVLDRPESRDMHIAQHVQAWTVAFPSSEKLGSIAVQSEVLAELPQWNSCFRISVAWLNCKAL
jgi:hypothetical protein